METVKVIALKGLQLIRDGAIENFLFIRNTKEVFLNAVIQKLRHIVVLINQYLASQLQPQLPITKQIQTVLFGNLTDAALLTHNFPKVVEEIILMPIQSLLLSLILILKGFLIFMISIVSIGCVVVVPLYITKYLIMLILLPLKWFVPSWYDRTTSFTKEDWFQIKF